MDHLRRSTRNLAFLLCLLSACITGLYWAGDNTAEAEENIFRIPANAVVENVHLASDRDSVQLKRSPAGWSMADSVRAGQDRVRVLFAALEKMRPGRGPGKRLYDSLKSAFQQNGVRVTITTENEGVLSFAVVGNEERQETWLSTPDGSRIWRMSIPGYRTYLMDIFSADPDAWRDTRIFNLNWRNFSGYSAHFPGRVNENFTVEQQQGVFGVSGISTDTARLNSYLDAVSLMSAESVKVPGPEELRRLLDTPVEVDLQVREVSGSFFSVSVLRSGNLLVQPKPGRYFTAEINPAQRRILLLPRRHFQRQN